MRQKLHIDFVSDVSCTWCAVGLRNLDRALGQLGPEIEVEFNVQPFELNPKMPSGGQNLLAHLQENTDGTRRARKRFSSRFAAVANLSGSISALMKPPDSITTATISCEPTSRIS